MDVRNKPRPSLDQDQSEGYLKVHFQGSLVRIFEADHRSLAAVYKICNISDEIKTLNILVGRRSFVEKPEKEKIIHKH